MDWHCPGCLREAPAGRTITRCARCGGQLQLLTRCLLCRREVVVEPQREEWTDAWERPRLDRAMRFCEFCSWFVLLGLLAGVAGVVFLIGWFKSLP